MFVGLVFGINRDLRGKSAGVRTLVVVALGAAAAAMLCNGEGTATGHVLQGVLTGTGFLGAGVILHGSGYRSIQGLTTAATIWTTAVLGVACGLGAWGPVLVSTGG